MLDGLFKGILNLVFFFIKIVGNLIFFPIQFTLVALYPNLGPYLAIAQDFIVQKIYPVGCWIKCSFINVACVPDGIWEYWVLTMTMFFIAAPVFRSVRLLYNIWRIWRGTQK